MRWTAPFLTEVLQRGRQIGALAPTSAGLAAAMTDVAGVGSAARIVELGAGTGAVTEQIIRKKRSDAEVLVLERNVRFAELLSLRFPQLWVECHCATRLAEITSGAKFFEIDSVLSTLPWTSLPEDVQRGILGNVSAILAPTGSFTTIACYGLHVTRAGRRFGDLLREIFDDVGTEAMTWGNIPPAFVYHCTMRRKVPDSLREEPGGDMGNKSQAAKAGIRTRGPQYVNSQTT
jgi:phosphatidylethanolamine/phosphatidyl-N-methylethanolamine N-methyltransferase